MPLAAARQQTLDCPDRCHGDSSSQERQPDMLGQPPRSPPRLPPDSPCASDPSSSEARLEPLQSLGTPLQSQSGIAKKASYSKLRRRPKRYFGRMRTVRHPTTHSPIAALLSHRHTSTAHHRAQPDPTRHDHQRGKKQSASLGLPKNDSSTPPASVLCTSAHHHTTSKHTITSSAADLPAAPWPMCGPSPFRTMRRILSM